MTKQVNKQSGFAIGLILLAVVLIAAIVAAIAVSTQDSGSSGDREQARINASTLVQQGIALKNAALRYDALGLNNGADAIADNDFGSMVGVDGTIGALPDAEAVVAGATWDVGVSAAAGSGTFAYLAGVPAQGNQICEQINSILHNAATAPADNFAEAAPTGFDIDADGDADPEGCTVDNAGDNTGTYFVRILQNHTE